MENWTKMAFIGLFALILISANVSAATKSIDSEAKKYVLRGESATYFILNTTEGNVYYIVQIDDKNSLVFTENVEIVLNPTQLSSILKEYYAQSGASGFTDASKQKLLDDFNQSDFLYNKCHNNFYNYVETNFFWFQFNCIKLSVGIVCDREFAQRAKMNASWAEYRDSVQALKTATSSTDIKNSLEKIEAAAKKAKNDTLYFDDKYTGYSYFLGNTMDKDPACKFDYSLMDSVLSLSSTAMRNKITDVDSEALELIKVYDSRKDILRLKELQTQGLGLMQKAINASTLPIKYRPMTDKLKAVEASYDALRNATTFDSANTYFAAMNKDYADLEQMVKDPNSLLFIYNKTLTDVKAAEKAIEEAKKKYGKTDDRIITLNNEYYDVIVMLNETDHKFANKTQVTAAELDAIDKKAISVASRAEKLQIKQNEFDTPTVVMIVVIIATIIGIIIYVLKFKKKGGPTKQMEYKQVAGSGQSRASIENERVDKEQNRQAMFPKL